MTSKKKRTATFVAFLRGINVGGHHKVPMLELQKVFQEMGFEKIITLLNSGNIIFDAYESTPGNLEKMISEQLEKTFGFPVPTIIRTSETICKLFNRNPFLDVKLDKDIRWYVSFLKKDTSLEMKLPWRSPDSAFEILEKDGKSILSVLDLSISQTPKAMGALEKSFGKDITTRNWKTIERVAKKLQMDP